MPGRIFTSSLGYRYGYQGSEKDDEVKGSGNSYTTEYRILDTRLGRWLSIDPKADCTVGESPYVSMGNNPILFNDPFGDIVAYEKFRDRVSVFVARKVSKSFNEKYKKYKSDEITTYTFKNRGGNPSLIDGGPNLVKVNATNVDALYGCAGPPYVPIPVPSTDLDDEVRSPKSLAKPGSVFKASYTITDFNHATLEVSTVTFEDKIEITSKGKTFIYGNASKDAPDGKDHTKGYSTMDSSIDLKALFDAGIIDNHITIQITGNPKRNTIWHFRIKADGGSLDKDGYKDGDGNPVRVKKSGTIKD